MNLNAVSCLTEDVIHHRFRLQQDNLPKTEYRKIDLNRIWEVKADSHVFLFCIGRAEIKHVFGWCSGLEVVNQNLIVIRHSCKTRCIFCEKNKSVYFDATHVAP